MRKEEMTKGTLLARAIAIASSAHENQLDKGGNAYILHPMRIMMRLRTDDTELMTIAILHDVVEDSDWTIEDLYNEGFSNRVLDALELMTHDKDEDYTTYIKRIATNSDCIKVKKEDLRDNMDPSRLKGLSRKDFDRMEKYQKAFKYLCAAQDAMRSAGYC